MIPDRLAAALAAGAKRASTHAVRAAAETLAAVTAFIDEVSSAFDDDDGSEDGPTRIDVEPDTD